MKSKITFGLSVAEVDNAIKQLREYQKKLAQKCQILAERLAEHGVYIAKIKIAEEGAIYSGDLIESIAFEHTKSTINGGIWTIYTDCPYAKYVEFGFGIVGSQNPHPDTSIVGWKYDINSHGEKGWFYMKNGEWHWSKGQPSKPFMWSTAIELKRKVLTITREVFAE